LKNVFWWYLLPPLIGIGAVMGSKIWNQRHEGLTEIILLAGVYVFTYGFTFGVAYWANQNAVRKELDPRRKELEALLASLK
ncbi:MAG: hypothetical protein JWQ71_766, partial [Pedosphaera sp.]|nr:hypothetical protein [Pedosphaera sp.]